MPFFTKMGLGFRYLQKWGRPAPYSRNVSPDELAGIAREAGFVIEGAKLLGKDTKKEIFSPSTMPYVLNHSAFGVNRRRV